LNCAVQIAQFLTINRCSLHLRRGLERALKSPAEPAHGAVSALHILRITRGPLGDLSKQLEKRMKNNLSTKHSVVDILRRRAGADGVVVICPVATRPTPVKQSALAPYKHHMVRMRQEGKSLRQIADWILAVSGNRPHKSTVLRQLHAARPGDGHEPA
jgi:hypothetical protein